MLMPILLYLYKIKDPVLIDLLPVFQNQHQEDLFIKHHQICNTTNSHTCITYEIMVKNYINNLASNHFFFFHLFSPMFTCFKHNLQKSCNFLCEYNKNFFSHALFYDFLFYFLSFYIPKSRLASI